jgi:type III pantothenate kinase
VGTSAQITPDEYAMTFKDLFGFAGLEFSQITGVIISTVVPPLLPVMTEMARKYFKIAPLVVTHELKTGITIRYDNPKEVGADRIVNAAAAFKLYGGPLIIVDFGTATTFDVISKDGRYLGGVIAPGVLTGAENLVRRAARLGAFEIKAPPRVVGKSTEESLQSGLLYGAVGQVDTIVRRIAAETRMRPVVIATGGLAKAIAPHSKTIQEVDAHLTLHGLRMILERGGR